MMVVVVNALVAGIISGAGVILASVAAGQPLSEAVWIVAGCTALVSAGKDWQSRVAVPPAKP